VGRSVLLRLVPSLRTGAIGEGQQHEGRARLDERPLERAGRVVGGNDLAAMGGERREEQAQILGTCLLVVPAHLE
jgi:hypothetical protein